MKKDNDKKKAAALAMVRQNTVYLRTTRSWSQYEMADKLNMTRATISAMESGQTIPKSSTLQKMLQEFNITWSDFTEKDLSKIKRLRKPETIEAETVRIEDLQLTIATQQKLIKSLERTISLMERKQKTRL